MVILLTRALLRMYICLVTRTARTKVNNGRVKPVLVYIATTNRPIYIRDSVYIGRAAYVHVAFTANASSASSGASVSREVLRVILAPAVTRRIFHASHFLVTDTRLPGQAAICKRSSLVVLFMARSMHTPPPVKRRIAFNGTLQIGTISMVYSLVVTFSITRRSHGENILAVTSRVSYIHTQRNCPGSAFTWD